MVIAFNDIVVYVSQNVLSPILMNISKTKSFFTASAIDQAFFALTLVPNYVNNYAFNDCPVQSLTHT